MKRHPIKILRGSAVLIFSALLILMAALPLYAAEYPDMPVPAVAGNCAACHDALTHPVNDCSKCHDEGKYLPEQPIAAGHGGLNVSAGNRPLATAPVGNCIVCHRYDRWEACTTCHFDPTYPLIPVTPTWAADYTHDGSRLNNYTGTDNIYTCEICHNADWPTLPAHAAGFGSAASHLSSTTGCTSCHDSSLTREHFRYTDTGGYVLTCYTCHASASPEVKMAVRAGSSSCGACHPSVHQIGTVAAISPAIPTTAIKYPGLEWSSPVPLAIWQGEPWVQGDPAGFRVIISQRAVLSSDQVWQFYNDGLTAAGWSLASPAPAPGVTEFTATFTKGRDKIIIWFHGSESPGGQGSVSSGSRLEVIFNG